MFHHRKRCYLVVFTLAFRWSDIFFLFASFFYLNYKWDKNIHLFEKEHLNPFNTFD